MPLADRVEALTRSTGRALVEGDAALATSLLADDGEHARLESALDGAWSDLLRSGSERQPMGDMAAGVGLVASFQTISKLAASICANVIQLSERPERGQASAILRLAEMVPDLLGDALGALRENDQEGARAVQRRGLAVDACFAQTYLDLHQIVRRNDYHLEIAQRLHAVTAALERISDGASEIAGTVRKNSRVEA
jgi:phosphate uptake regulator